MDWRSLRADSQGWQIFRQRAEIINRVRHFFLERNFLEVSTPVLVPSLLPESYLEVIKTQVSDEVGRTNSAFLTPSPELWHKKLLVAGSGPIFEITKSFRDGDVGSPRHNLEFTLLEWYQPEADYQVTMTQTEELVAKAAGQAELEYRGRLISLDPPFSRLTMVEAFARWLKISEADLFDRRKLIDWAREHGYQVSADDDWETVFNLLYVGEVEPQLGLDKPVFLTNYPAAFAPLAKSCSDPRFKQRFELYLGGVEIADGYSELTDPVEQARQFDQEVKSRKKLGLKDYPVDNEFLAALEVGLPACSGVALGLDRLVMLLLNKTSLDEVTFFTGREIFHF